MSEIDDYVKNARDNHGASDADIKKQLESSGWDKQAIDAALSGRSGLPPAPKPNAGQSGAVNQHKGLSSLAAALHHVLLWLFTASVSVTVPIVIAVLYSGNDATTAIASYIAVVLATLTPYALFYVAYLQKFRSEPVTTTNKVWSIITIIFHTIGALGSLITLIINLIVGPIPQVYLSAIVIGVLNLLVVVTYFTATFVGPDKYKLRKAVLYGYLPIVVVGLVIIGVISLSRLGPAKHDTEQRQKLADVVRGVREYYVDHDDTLPTNLDQVDVDEKSGVKYQRLTATKYEVCADFKTKVSRPYGSYYYENDERTDTYVYEGHFDPKDTGENCFTFRTQQSLRPGSGSID